MSVKTLLPIFLLASVTLHGQTDYTLKFISDSTMRHASLSLIIIDANSSEVIVRKDEKRSLRPASVMKLLTTAAAIELLGPGYTFSTEIGYTGHISSGSLNGDIIIRGGGDPALGSEYFRELYGEFIDKWADEISKLGIKKVKGKVITDDSWYDFQPVPPEWNWEDIGNYYGAGAYGLSIFDNTLKIHFRTGDEGSAPSISSVYPSGSGIEYINYLTCSGSADRGTVYSAPYSEKGWISGYIPVNSEDFVLKASIPDPPLMAATLLDKKLRNAGIRIKDMPSSARVEGSIDYTGFKHISSTTSPPLSSIIEILNHESSNLYAEHLLKELGKVFNGHGTTAAGTEIVLRFLDSLGVEVSGIFMEDGSGLSPADAICSEDVASLLFLMRKKGRSFVPFYNSIPEAGKEGTLRNYFKDPVFESSLRAKSGTLLRSKSYAGYITTESGKELIFSIIVNNFTDTPEHLVARIEELLKGIILNE